MDKSDRIKGRLIKNDRKWYVDINKELTEISYSSLKRAQLKEGVEVEGFMRIKQNDAGNSFNTFVITSNDIIPRPYMNDEAYKTTISILDAYDTPTLTKIMNRIQRLIKDR